MSVFPRQSLSHNGSKHQRKISSFENSSQVMLDMALRFYYKFETPRDVLVIVMRNYYPVLTCTTISKMSNVLISRANIAFRPKLRISCLLNAKYSHFGTINFIWEMTVQQYYIIETCLVSLNLLKSIQRQMHQLTICTFNMMLILGLNKIRSFKVTSPVKQILQRNYYFTDNNILQIFMKKINKKIETTGM